ncbi:MAG: AAA family ATPase [Candidatus Omnitrophica bacterium]|nr:AAA family ATPase [Candidatus Omnitrophota bacterium]
MYEQFYNLNEKPFSVTPDTKFFFSSEKHQEALSSLIYAIEDRKGFAVITGEIGSGKTTVWHALLNNLGKSTKVALITNTHLTQKQVIIAILEEFDIAYNVNWPKIKLLSKLNSFLLEQIAIGFNIVVIIDEAQNLSPKVLEEVRMLSNLETEKEKLIQIILMGQPELRDILLRKELEQLRQRIAMYYHISPLDYNETKKYIEHRLKIAGANGNIIFEDLALESIYISSGGIPRRINFICDRSMLSGFLRDRNTIDQKIIVEAVTEIDCVLDYKPKLVLSDELSCEITKSL